MILPCLGRTERDVQKSGPQFVTVEDTTGVVHQSHGSLAPASEHLRSEPAIVAGIAMAALNGLTTVDWQGVIENYDRIREHIEHVVPGFTQYNARVRQPGGFYLPNAPRDGKFKTPSCRARFTVHAIPRHELKDGELLLTTVRSHDQFNTTIYGENDRYRGVSNGRRVVFMNRADMDRLGIEKNQWVDLISHFESESRRAERFEAIPYEIPEGCAAAYYPETNVLVPIRSVAEGSDQPVSKSIVITVEPVGRPGGDRHKSSESSRPVASSLPGNQWRGASHTLPSGEGGNGLALAAMVLLAAVLAAGWWFVGRKI